MSAHSLFVANSNLNHDKSSCHTGSIFVTNSKVGLPIIDGILFIKLAEISHFKSEDVYSRLYTTDGNVHFVKRSLKWIQSRIEVHYFYRIHNSYFINLMNIYKHVSADGGYILMDNGSQIPVSRSKKDELKQLLGLN